MIFHSENTENFLPLTEAQKELLAKAAFAPPSILNLCVRIDFLEDIHEDLFLKAISKTVENVPYSRYRLHKNINGDTVQYESDIASQAPFSVHDFSARSEAYVSRQLKKWSSEPFPNNLLDTQLYRFELIKLKNGKTALFFSAHHVIMDIFAVVYFLRYLLKVYLAYIDGSDMPEPSPDPQKYILNKKEFYSSEKYEHEINWLINEFKEEPQFTSINGLGNPEFIKGRRYGKDRGIANIKAKEVVYRIDKELVEKISNFTIARNISPYVFFVLILRSYLAFVNKTDDVTFMSLVANRGTLYEKKIGLNTAVGSAFRSILSDELTLNETLKELDCINKNFLKHFSVNDVTNFIAQYHSIPDGMTYSTVMLSYATFLDFNELPIKIKAEKIDSGISLAPLYILLTSIDTTGDLCVFYQYSVGYTKLSSVEKFHQFMLNFIRIGIENPDKTIAELTQKCM